MELQPLKDHVIIRPVRRIETTRHGIVVPDVAPEAIQRGVVVAVGPRCVELRTGDEVLFERHGGVEFAPNGERLVRFEEMDVLAVVEGDDVTPEERSNVWLSLPAVTRDKDRWRLS